MVYKFFLNVLIIKAYYDTPIIHLHMKTTWTWFTNLLLVKAVTMMHFQFNHSLSIGQYSSTMSE